MDDLGGSIKRQREAKQMTLEELSSRTKISLAVLKDIENGKFDRYKGDEAYVKMYLKKISQALNMDSVAVADQYLELTREIELEEMHVKEDLQQHNQNVVKKGKKFSFEAPQLARKPSVYEDKSHVTIIRAGIILVLVCLVIVVVWLGIYLTRQKAPEPSFGPQNNTTVEGEVTPGPDEEPSTQPADSDVMITRNSQLNYNFKLPEGVEKFTFKVEFGNKSWSSLKVNGLEYAGFEAKIYAPSADGSPETVELEFNKTEFDHLALRIGYANGHKFYINGQEIPLSEEDVVFGATTLNLTLEKE